LFLADVALGYNNYVRVPLVGEFVDTMLAIYQPTGRRLEADQPWKVKSAFHASPGWVLDTDPICQRYGLAPEELAEMRAMVRGASRFVFLEHPGFETLARVDYG